MDIFNFITPVIYWVLILMWVIILILYFRFRRLVRTQSNTLKIFLTVLAIDAFRTLFESIYFGGWYTARAGIIPENIYHILVQPQFVIVPKILNLLAAALVMGILIRQLIPSIIKDENDKNAQIRTLTTEIKKRKLAEAELEKANELLKQESETDFLTGIPNRLAFDRRLNENIATAQRNNHSLSLLMIDIDHFKDCNDTYGHDVGDVVLQRVADTINNQLVRKTDLLARFGGEEFVVLLPETDTSSAFEMAEKIRTSVLLLGIKYDKLAVKYSTAVSIGISSLTADKYPRKINLTF